MHRATRATDLDITDFLPNSLSTWGGGGETLTLFTMTSLSCLDGIFPIINSHDYMQRVQKHLHNAAGETLSVHLISSYFPFSWHKGRLWCSGSPTNRRGAFDGILANGMEVEITEVISRPHF